jgi:hypothetical protein
MSEKSIPSAHGHHEFGCAKSPKRDIFLKKDGFDGFAFKIQLSD